MGLLFHAVHLGVVFFCFFLFLIPAIFYLITLQNALVKCPPGVRTMEPGMVWLLLIPLFHLIWQFFVVMALGNSLGNEFRRRGIPCPDPLPGQSIGMAMCICGCCGIIPIINFLALPAAFVLWIVYWVKIAEFSRALDIPLAMYTPPPAF
ncbi:MAG TPA: hypothetical protein VL986_04430 [Terracidiphilus sp.]|nr:hypothetical protein [Terracidiphilus sp.]